jgi:hypothetical protein
LGTSQNPLTIAQCFSTGFRVESWV